MVAAGLEAGRPRQLRGGEPRGGGSAEHLLLLVAAGIEVGRSGGGKLLFLVVAGMEVHRRGRGQLILLRGEGQLLLLVEAGTQGGWS